MPCTSSRKRPKRIQETRDSTAWPAYTPKKIILCPVEWRNDLKPTSKLDLLRIVAEIQPSFTPNGQDVVHQGRLYFRGKNRPVKVAVQFEQDGGQAILQCKFDLIQTEHEMNAKGLLKDAVPITASITIPSARSATTRPIVR